MRDEEMLAETEDYLEGFNQPTFRGMGQWGSGCYLVEPAWLEPRPQARGRLDPVDKQPRPSR